MWIIARFLIALGAACYRLFLRNVPRRFPYSTGDIKYSLRTIRSKHRVLRHILETPVASSFICVLTHETSLDRFFKAIGFGEELQTGDSAFDNQIYILGDHPLVHSYLGDDRNLRDRILSLIPSRAISIAITGETVRVVVRPDAHPEDLLADLREIRLSVWAMQSKVRSRFTDPFYMRALIAQALVWGIAMYALEAFIGFLGVHEDIHLWPYVVLKWGELLALGLTGVGVALVGMLLGRSSRTPRIIAESSAILLVSLMLGGPQFVGDMNRLWDRSAGWTIVREVQDLQARYHRGSRRYSSGHYTYHLTIAQDPGDDALPFKVPRSIEVSSYRYHRLREHGYVALDIGEGFLGFPWFRNIDRYERQN